MANANETRLEAGNDLNLVYLNDKELSEEAQEIKKKLNNPLQVLLVGIPNVGKSSLVNR